MAETIDNMKEIIEAARAVREPALLDANEKGDEAFVAPFLVLPKAGGGSEVASVKGMLDAYRPWPERRKGVAVLLDLASFIAHASRFKDEHSAVFITEEPPCFLAVLNYHEKVTEAGAEAAKPRFGDHRGTYRPTLSPEWKAWTDADGEWLNQEDFAALVVDHARDILDVNDLRGDETLGELPAWFAARFGGKIGPTDFYARPQRMLDLAEGLSVAVEDKVSDVTKLSGGITKIAFESKATPDVEVPGAFVLAIPVFLGEEASPYQIPARLRWKLVTQGDSKRVAWRFDLYGVDRTMRACLADMRETVNAGTGLPSFMGSPE